MIRKILTVLLFLTTSIIVKSQTVTYKSSIGSFKNASSFYINSAGFIFVTDAGTDEVYKLDTLGNTLKDAGGYGWNDGNFDNPSDVFATTLNVYVCDKNNHRVERFDKYLNFISKLYTRDNDNSDERFGYPLCCATSQQGDLYILDSENKRIIKFDLFGNFISNFGGYDAGNFTLENPLKFAISSNNNIYVIDKKKIVLFDQYGNGVTKYNTDLDLKGININYNMLTLNTKNEVMFSDLTKPEFSLKKITLIGMPDNSEIVSSFIFNSKLYLLTSNHIQIYKIVSE